MTDVRRAGWQKPEGRITRRLMDVVRGVITALLRPAMAFSSPVVGLVARKRTRARLRLAAGSQAEHVASAARAPGPSLAEFPGRNDGRSAAWPALRAVAPIGRTHAHTGGAAKRDELFSTIRVDPDFSPRAYARTFAALQLPPSAKLLDLTPARMICADLFGRLAEAWTAPPGVVPRLGILLSFERWVILRETALAALQSLTLRGVQIAIFYDEQAWGDRMGTWFSSGQVVHNVSAVISTLTLRWQPSAIWPVVIDALSRLVRAHTCAAELPTLLTEVAGLALSCGGAEQAIALAREALDFLPEAPSAIRSQALRELGTALIGQGQPVTGLAYLDEAIAMAKTAKDPMVGASALCQSGLYALNHADYPNAERRFRGAIALLSPRTKRPQLLALAHHSLAVTLMNQGSDEAEYHATAALALRLDPHSHLAEEDRILLERLRDARTN